MAPSVNSRYESIKLLRLPTKFKISIDDMSLFSWSLLNRTKDSSEVGKIVARCHDFTGLLYFTE